MHEVQEGNLGQVQTDKLVYVAIVHGWVFRFLGEL
jgi:hypothetical protein